jgi:hypothetical protein
VKIDYAVISADDSHYLDFYEVVSKMWNHFGIKTMMLHVTNTETEFQENEFGLYKKIKSLEAYPTSWQAQLVRLFAYRLSENENLSLLMSDIDMVPLQGQYFHSEAESLADDEILSYTGQPYGSVPFFPMCYMLAKSRLTSDVLNLPQKYEEFLGMICSRYTVKWNSDEHFLYDSVKNYGKLRIAKRKRSFKEDRIDRGNWSYDSNRLQKSDYIDCHMLRPYLKFKDQIDVIVNKVTL